MKLNGSGASFPFPIYAKWFKDFSRANKDIRVDYQAKGSGAGIQDLINGVVDFAASDAAMKDDEMAQVKQGVVLLPMTAGEVVLAYNLNGVNELKLTRDVYPEIFLGKITRSGMTEALDDVAGDFAFARFDGTRLLLARDAFAMRPLFWARRATRSASRASPRSSSSWVSPTESSIATVWPRSCSGMIFRIGGLRSHPSGGFPAVGGYPRWSQAAAVGWSVVPTRARRAEAPRSRHGSRK